MVRAEGMRAREEFEKDTLQKRIWSYILQYLFH